MHRQQPEYLIVECQLTDSLGDPAYELIRK